MPDQPDDTQKQQRRSTALPPFFAPRTTRPTTPTPSGASAPARRSSQLFTPPGVAKQPRPTTPTAAPVAPRRMTPFSAPAIRATTSPLVEPPALEPSALEPSALEPSAPEPSALEPAAFEAAPEAPAPPAAPAADADATPPTSGAPTTDAQPPMPNAELRDAATGAGEPFVIEQFEQAPISLRATGDHGVVQDESTLSFQVYDDATRLLERGARSTPADDADSLEIERTEVVFEAPAESAPEAPAETRLEVERFWAAESAAAGAGPEPAAGAAPVAPLGVEPDAEPAAGERDTQPMLEAIAPPAPDTTRVPSWLEDARPEAEAMIAPAAEPASEAASEIASAPILVPAAPAAPAAGAPDDAEEALAEAFAEPAPNESVPRWATPRVNRAVDDDRPAAPNDTGTFTAATPPDELAAALAWPDSGLRTPTPVSVPAVGAKADTSHEMAASAEGWPLSVGGGPGAPDAVAAALERIAQRVRAGDVPLPADVQLAKSDESALALTLAALLRAGGAPRA